MKKDYFDISQVLPLTRWKDTKAPECEYFSCDESEDEEDSDDEPIIIPKKKPKKKVAPPRLIITKKQTVPRIRQLPIKRALPPPPPPGPPPGPPAKMRKKIEKLLRSESRFPYRLLIINQFSNHSVLRDTALRSALGPF